MQAPPPAHTNICQTPLYFTISLNQLWLQFLTDPVEPGLFYKHLFHWFIQLFINSVSHPFPSEYHQSQTIRDRELKFWENVHPPQLVTCHMSPVMCHMSHIKSHMQQLFFYKVVKLIVEGSVIHGAYPVVFFLMNLWLEYFVWDSAYKLKRLKSSSKILRKILSNK